LDGVTEPKVEVVGFGPRRDDGTTDAVDGVPRHIASDREKVTPETPIGVNDKETLTEHDKKCNMEDRIGCELMKLHTIHKQKPTPNFVGRKR
jgi:hypothetical protein